MKRAPAAVAAEQKYRAWALSVEGVLGRLLGDQTEAVRLVAVHADMMRLYHREHRSHFDAAQQIRQMVE